MDMKRKEDFLLKLLEGNDILKGKFIDNYKDEYEKIRLHVSKPYEPEVLMQSIEDEAEIFREEIEEVDFEEVDWESYNSHGHYVPEYEIAAELAEEEANDFLQPWLDKLKEAMQFNDFTEIVRRLSAIVLGSETAEINDPDENLSPEPNRYFIDRTKEFLDTRYFTLKDRYFSDDDLRNGFDLLFRFNQKCFSESISCLGLFQDLLIKVTTNKSSAEFIDEAIVKYHADLRNTPSLGSHIALKLNDIQRWVATLEDSFGLEYSTSEQLTDYYFKNDKVKFDQFAFRLFTVFGSKAIDNLMDKVKKGSAVHIAILEHLVIYKADYGAYIELKQYIDTAQAEAIIDNLNYPDSKVKFYGKERNFDKLEALIHKNLKEYQSFLSINYREALKYLYPEKPDAAWEIAKKIIIKKMSSDKNRDTYQMLAGLLGDAKHYLKKQPEVQQVIMDLYGHRPNLPALKDEFRKAGLMT
ncbi:MAG: hypothetical protein CVT92_05535 [Bacteroidetes bacterium HGW-Bacteroidetes-1]|nr:MAG: hypothetical protein CVT92_05535 [Bacteroidetes bacterium HGW-Bacteroidetes-1]